MKHYDMTGMRKILERQKQMMKNLESISRPHFKGIQYQSKLFKNIESLSKGMLLRSNDYSHLVPAYSKLIPKFNIPSSYFKNALRIALINDTTKHFDKIGIFPHPKLIKILENDTRFDLENITTNNDEWLNTIWSELRENLCLEKNACFNDDSLFFTYKDLLDGHENKLYNLSDGALAKIVERTMILAVPEHNTSKVGNKINTFFNPVPLSRIGGRYDWALLMFLAKPFTTTSKNFSGHRYHPNRNIISHGVKLDKLVIFDSINCVLLAHWIIDKTNSISSINPTK
ncbi:hypothetical protein NBRC116602_14070 [Hyphomicrobiales bacterium 4NK60-0047b]